MTIGTAGSKPTLASIFLAFLRLGATAFGGPAMVAYISDLSVRRKKWLDEGTFREGVALCQAVPGATAMQTAAFVGLSIRGVPGALASFVGFGLPAFLLMVILSSLYVASRDLPWASALFRGLQVVVVAIIANGVYTFGRSNLKNRRDVLIAGAAASLFGLGVSPFYVIVGATLAGMGLETAGTASQRPGSAPYGRLPIHHVLVLLLIIGLGLLVLSFTNGPLFDLSLLLMRIDLFAFGGGFAAIPLMLQQIVHAKGWLDERTLMDGIALGQITPGPIVITATFVGYLLLGLKGAVSATLAIFAPSFVLVLLGSMVFDRLKRSPFFLKAIKGILASFVGLLLFVLIKFVLAASWTPLSILMCLASFGALLRKVDILYVVPIAAALSILLFR